MSNKQLANAQKGLAKLTTRRGELQKQLDAAAAELEKKQATMGQALIDGGDVDQVTAELAELERRRDGHAAALALADKQVDALTGQVAELQMAADLAEMRGKFDAAKGELQKSEKIAKQLDNLANSLEQLNGDAQAIIARYRAPAQGRGLNTERGQYFQLRKVIQHLEAASGAIREA